MSSQILATLPGNTFPVTRTPMRRSIIQTAASGKEVRIAVWSYPKWKWSFSYSYLSTVAGIEHFQYLVGFFNLMNGDFDTFLFQDPYDNYVAAQNIGTGTGSLSTFQLKRFFGTGVEYIYDVDSRGAPYAVNPGAPLIYLNGVLKTAGSDYNISATGLVTFTSAPGGGVAVTATFSYLWRVRFSQNSLDFEEFLTNLYELKTMELLQANP